MAAAHASGIERVVQVGIDVPSSRWSVGRRGRTRTSGPRSRSTRTRSRRGGAGGEPKRSARPPTPCWRDRGARGAATGRGPRRDRPRPLRGRRRRRPDGAGGVVPAHIAIAKDTGKAVMIHDREAHEDVLRVLEERGRAGAGRSSTASPATPTSRAAAPTTAMCCRSPATSPSRTPQDLRDAVAVAPPDQLLVETDAPFLTPMPHRGQPNSPYLVPLTVRATCGGEGLVRGAVRRGHRHRERSSARGVRPGASADPDGGLPSADRRPAAGRGARPSADEDARPELRHRPGHGPAHRDGRAAPDDDVIEVGPGLGSLTLALLPVVSRVVAVEIDPVLARVPRSDRGLRPPSLASRLEVVTADAEFDGVPRRAAHRAGRQPALQRVGAGAAAPARAPCPRCAAAWSWCRPRSRTG